MTRRSPCCAGQAMPSRLGHCRIQGRVEVAILRGKQAVIEVTDDGPGFGNGPAGMASLGLRVAGALLASCGGQLEVAAPVAGGTQVRIVLPTQPAARALR